MRNRNRKIDDEYYLKMDNPIGWHFSYTEDVEYKVQNFLHSEFRNVTNDYFENMLKKGINPFHKTQMYRIENVKLPKYISDNIEKFDKFILK